MDFAGPFERSMWLIVVDAHTKWPEVVAMKVRLLGKPLPFYDLSFPGTIYRIRLSLIMVPNSLPRNTHNSVLKTVIVVP